MSVSSMVSDPEFQKLPIGEQQATLSQLDPAFKKLNEDDFSGVVTGLQKHALSRPDLSAPPAAAGPHVEMEQNALGKPAQNATLPPDAQIKRNGKMVPVRMSDLAPEERTQAVEYHEEDPEFGKHTYEGAKSALIAASAPAAIPLESAAVLPTILGLAGGTAGSYGASKLAKKAGADEFGQEVAGDVGGLAGGVLGAESPNVIRAVKSGVQSGLPVRAAARGTQALLVDPLTDTATAAVKPFVKGYRAIRDINTPVDEILPIKMPKPQVPGQDYGIPTVRAAKGTVGRDYVLISAEPTPAAKPAGNFGRIAYGERTPFDPKAEGLVDNSHVPESNEPIPAAKEPGLPRIEYGDPTEFEPEITPEHVKSSPGTSMGDLTSDERDLIQTIRAESRKASAPEGFQDTAETADDVNQKAYAGKVAKGRAMKANAAKLLEEPEGPPSVGKIEAAESEPQPVSTASPEDLQSARNIVKDQSEQELIKAGKKYGVDHEQYDFKKRDANRHRVERDQFVNDVVEKMPDSAIQKLVESEAAFDDKDSNVFDQPSRNSASRAERAKAIWDRVHRPKVKTEAEAEKAGYTAEEIANGEHLLPVSGGSGVGEGLGNSGNSPPLDSFSEEAHQARQTALGKTQEYQDYLAPEGYKPQRGPEDLSDQFLTLRDPDQQRFDRFNAFTHRNGPLIPDVDTPARLENMHRRAYAEPAPQLGKIKAVDQPEWNTGVVNRTIESVDRQIGSEPRPGKLTNGVGYRTPRETLPKGLGFEQHTFPGEEPVRAEKPESSQVITNSPRRLGNTKPAPENVVGREGIPGRKTVRDVEDLIPVEMNRVNQALGKVAPASKPWEAPGVVSDIQTRTTRPGSIVEDENVLPENRVELPRTTDAQVKERALANRTRANAEVTRLQKAGMGADDPAMKKAVEDKRAAELLYQKSLRKTKLQSDYKDVLLPENRPEPAFGSAYRRR